MHATNDEEDESGDSDDEGERHPSAQRRHAKDDARRMRSGGPRVGVRDSSDERGRMRRACGRGSCRGQFKRLATEDDDGGN